MTAPESSPSPAATARRPAESSLSRRVMYGLLAVVVVSFGVNWPVMSAGVRHISPVWMGAFRVGSSLLVFACMAVARGRLRLPPRSDWPIVASLALFGMSAVNILVFTALQIVPPGRSSVLTWTTPLWAVPIAAVFLGDRMTRSRWAGLALGIAGVVVLFEPWRLDWGDRQVVVGHLLLLLAAVINAAVSVHIRGHRWTITPLDALPWQLAGATAVLSLVAWLTEGAPRVEWTPLLVGNVAYQGVLVSGLALWAQIVIFRNIDPVSANLSMMGVPAIGVAASAVFAAEAVTFEVAAGLALIVSGVAVHLLSDRRRNPVDM